jgi:hypothetical protein
MQLLQEVTLKQLEAVIEMMLIHVVKWKSNYQIGCGHYFLAFVNSEYDTKFSYIIFT